MERCRGSSTGVRDTGEQSGEVFGSGSYSLTHMMPLDKRGDLRRNWCGQARKDNANDDSQVQRSDEGARLCLSYNAEPHVFSLGCAAM